ncbi:MAG TPA: NUDIX hydrolase [Polyangia bacterium]|jgi:ADP-ribose pyrophosphatase YjhB (NUDIX family)|nr:NUDIX hydrolase [Polyangia bacterium]
MTSGPVIPDYCSRCGNHRLRSIPRDSAVHCKHCGHVSYLNSKPSVCAVIVRRRRSEVLLVRDGRPSAGWDLPGGFLLYGESPETGLCRELKEEIDADIRSSQLMAAIVDDYAGQKGHSLNLFFGVQLKGNPSPSGEIEDCRWFKMQSLPKLRYRSVRQVLRRIENRRLAPLARLRKPAAGNPI